MLGPIDTIRIFTADLTKALPFYRDRLGMTPAITEDVVAIFDTGSVKLVLEAIDKVDDPEEADELVGRFTGISFATPDIRASGAAMEAKGVVFDGRPELQPWGGALANFFDPDGNILTLIQYPLPD